MSTLQAFLHPVQSTEPVEVVISKRFVGEDGKPVPFKIRPVTQEENDAITKRCMRSQKVNGQLMEKMDTVAYARHMIVAATVEPDFQREDICKAYSTMDPTEVPGRMLLVGEYAKLSKEIMQLSGFDTDSVEYDAKN